MPAAAESRVGAGCSQTSDASVCQPSVAHEACSNQAWCPMRGLPCVQFRTSYFPGLGWMMRRQLWEELSPKWPHQAWDHWMRLPSTSQGSFLQAPEQLP